MVLPIYQVDSFAAQVFEGNPAAVVVSERWLPDQRMQQIAAENNLSETAFVVQLEGSYEIRWFTPKAEVALCGHATLAAAKIIFEEYKYEGDIVTFQTKKAGKVTVKKLSDGRLSLNFPSAELKSYQGEKKIFNCFNIKPIEVFQAGEDIMLVYQDESEIATLEVDYKLLASYDTRAVIVTARGKQVDFVSRFFAPKLGINEDPVTGSAHTKLIPYWSQKLSKSKISARQISARGGSLWCENQGDRVYISGFATLYMKGEIII